MKDTRKLFDDSLKPAKEYKRCIFCKGDTSASKSVEHIIPESLGNALHTLPRGIVCDSCNNYFGSKIEGPLLSSLYFKNLRSRQRLVSKKGKIPFIDGLLLEAACPIHLVPEVEDDYTPIMAQDGRDIKKMVDYFKSGRPGNILIPIDPPLDKRLLSRFLTKVALEMMTHKICKYAGWEEQIIDYDELNEIREYARYGKGPKEWPFYERRIYGENHCFDDGKQTLHEFDLLYTEQKELYAIVCIFGVEYTINLGGPELDGYIAWLEKNQGKSFLYMK